MATLSTLRTHLQEILDIKSGDVFINSTYELELINQAYRLTAERHDFPQLLKRFADVIVAKLDRYDLQSDFRKFRFISVLRDEKEEVEFNNLRFSLHAFAVDRTVNEYVLRDIPQTASTPYTLSNSETAGDSVVIELDTVSGLIAGQEVFFDNSASSEFTIVQAVDSTNTTITARLVNSQASRKILYRVSEIIEFQYYKTPADLSSSGDVPLVPTPLQFTMLYYSAYLYFRKLQDNQSASNFKETFETELAEFFRSFDVSSTGHTNQFTL